MRNAVLPFVAAWLFLLPQVALADAQPGVVDSLSFARQEGGGHSCAVTFDDGPGKHTGRLLDILKDHGVRATFFVLGEHAEKAPELVRRIAAEGHEVENHSFDHPQLRQLDPESQRAEIERTEAILKGLGITPKFFRPPYGSYNAETLREAGEDKLVLALWSVDSLDWKYRTVHALEEHVLPKTPQQARGIFLFHDIHGSTVNAMPDILDKLKQDGCVFVTLSQWLDLHPDAVRARGGLADAHE